MTYDKKTRTVMDIISDWEKTARDIFLINEEINSRLRNDTHFDSYDDRKYLQELKVKIDNVIDWWVFLNFECFNIAELRGGIDDWN